MEIRKGVCLDGRIRMELRRLEAVEVDGDYCAGAAEPPLPSLSSSLSLRLLRFSGRAVEVFSVSSRDASGISPLLNPSPLPTSLPRLSTFDLRLIFALFPHIVLLAGLA